MYGKVGFLIPPLGIGYIASSLLEDGHHVEIIDFNIREDKDITKIDYAAYDFVGISTDTTKYYKALEIAEQAKKAGTLVMFGGPHASFMVDEILSTGYCDVVVINEGEITVKELCECIEKNRIKLNPTELAKVNGIAYLQNGGVVYTKPRAFIEDIDTIPLPARHIMNMHKYRELELQKRKITSIITSRGCPFDCKFCSTSRFTGLRWRTRSVDSILEETEELMDRYSFNAIAYMDDNFTLKPSRVIELSEKIIERKWDLYWWCFSRCDTIVKNEKMVEKMAESGCKYIFLGIENPDPDILDGLNKGISGDAAIKAVKILKKHGIDTLASYIIGSPEETEKNVKNTVKFAKKMNTGGVQFSILTPYPGTVLLEELKDKIIDTNWENYDCMHLVFKHKNFSPQRLRELLKKSYMKVYLTFSRIIKGIFSTLIGKGIKISTIKNMIKNFKADK